MLRALSGHLYLGMELSVPGRPAVGPEGLTSQMESGRLTSFPFSLLHVVSPGGLLRSSHELRGRRRWRWGLEVERRLHSVSRPTFPT